MPGRSAHDTGAGCRALRRFASIETFAVPQHHSRLRYAWDHARSMATRRVYTTFIYKSDAFDGRLAEILRTIPIDLIHVDSLDLARYLPACGGIPIICTHQ